MAACAAVIPAGTAPAATGAAAAGNGKVGVASAVYLDKNPLKLAQLGAKWAYDWTANVGPPQDGVQRIPMIWSRRYLTTTNIQALSMAQADGQAKYLLGFNEPDNRHQANLTPVQAANLWPKLEQTGLLLGSPATETPTNGWLKSFMAIAHRRDLLVNFITLHYYLDFTNPNAVAGMRKQLIQVHNAYHLPIWITELGALDIRRWGQPMLHPGTIVQAQVFMRKVFRMLNALPFVQRYAWYTDSCAGQPGCRFSSLFGTLGAVTPEGREFRRDA